MEQDKIIKGNKLIAEFMGANYLPEFHSYKMEYMEDAPHFTAVEMLYISDWNWLMEVVERIESLHDSISVDFKNNVCLISFNESKPVFNKDTYIPGRILTGGKESTKIEAVYNAVVQFIQWHNQQTA